MTAFEDGLRQIVREELRAVLSEMKDQRAPEFAREMSLEDAAAVAGKSVWTIRQWIKSGILPSTQFAARGPRTVNMADLEQVLRRHRGGQECQPSEESPLLRPGKTAGRQIRRAE